MSQCRGVVHPVNNKLWCCSVERSGALGRRGSVTELRWTSLRTFTRTRLEPLPRGRVRQHSCEGQHL